MSEELTLKKSTPGSNVPEFSVSELSFSLKRTIEENFGRVRVRGEIGRVTRAASGHVYTNLKDDGATIDAVCWKGTASKLSIQPEEGLEVICTGKLTTYPNSSKYQLVIDGMELAGEGALLKMLEERRKKLAAEGLFDAARKKEIPFLPEVIGVVTSPTGAVIRDILHRLEDRFPRHVLVWPVLVQGEKAAEQIAYAIKGFERVKPKPDLIIVARGGGSLEDLMAFNEEIVVRAAAECSIPLISAVGHETDTTLIDYAADLRAPTPTGAAEMAVPVRANLMGQTLENEHRLMSAMNRMLAENRHRLEARSRGLGDPAKLLEIKMQKLDRCADRLVSVLKHYIQEKRATLTEAAMLIVHPRDRLHREEIRLSRWSEQLIRTGSRLTQDLEKHLHHVGEMLKAYSFENTLQRGFAVIRGKNGAIISEAAQAVQAGEFDIQFKNKEKVAAKIKS